MQSTFPHGVFTLSLDFELVWGSRDVRSIGELEAQARITRDVLPRFLALLERYGIRATWATVGALLMDGRRPGDADPIARIPPPDHPWVRDSWFESVPVGTEGEHPEWFAPSLVREVLARGHEIGCHGFSHAIFGATGCARQTADAELREAEVLADELGIRMRSFVFPRNAIGHVDVVAAHSFRCYRGLEPTWYHGDLVPSVVRRGGHLVDVLTARTPVVAMPRRGYGGLWNVPGSMMFFPMDGFRGRIPVSHRVTRARRGIERAIQTGRVMHLWMHPINLATAPKKMLEGLEGVFAHVADRVAAGELRVWSMGEVAEAAEALEREESA